MPLTSFGPWQSRLGPPSAPSCPTVVSFDDIWGHFRVILGLILGTVGVFFGACRLQELKKEGSGRHSEPGGLFSSILGSAPRCSGGSRCSESSVFTWTTSGKECRLLVQFWSHFGSQKLNYTDFGVFLSQFWVPKWGVVLKVTFCGFPRAGRILRTRLVEGNWVLWGP